MSIMIIQKMLMMRRVKIASSQEESCLPVPEILGMIDTRVNRAGEFDFYP